MQASASLVEPRRVRLLSSVLSACLYAAWVAYGSRSHGAAAMLAAGVTQWLFSFAATFVFSALIGRLVWTSASRVRALLAGAGAAALYTCLLVTVHAALGTPQLLAVLWPVMAVASAYAFGFAWNQARHNAGRHAAGAL